MLNCDVNDGTVKQKSEGADHGLENGHIEQILFDE